MHPLTALPVEVETTEVSRALVALMDEYRTSYPATPEVMVRVRTVLVRSGPYERSLGPREAARAVQIEVRGIGGGIKDKKDVLLHPEALWFTLLVLDSGTIHFVERARGVAHVYEPDEREECRERIIRELAIYREEHSR